ncbi:MAG TPA: hypothetical protein VEL76_42310 [Gemmataceae bacterium]|nr:hypothetical protein [Gemmataceae bacterium]
MRSPTVDWIERFFIWSSVGVYLVAWVACLSVGFQPVLLPLAVATALAYTGAYVCVLASGGKCYLCADPRTLPVAFGVYAVGVTLYLAAGWLPEDLGWLEEVGLFGVALMAGHVLALAYSAAVDTVLRLAFRRRIRREQEWPNESLQQPAAPERLSK